MEPNNELINEKFKGVYARIDSMNELVHAELKTISKNVEATLAQALKTNGRVTKLESETIPDLNKELTFVKWVSKKPIRLVILVVIIDIITEYTPSIINFLKLL